MYARRAIIFVLLIFSGNVNAETKAHIEMESANERQRQRFAGQSRTPVLSSVRFEACLNPVIQHQTNGSLLFGANGQVRQFSLGMTETVSRSLNISSDGSSSVSLSENGRVLNRTVDGFEVTDSNGRSILQHVEIPNRMATITRNGDRVVIQYPVGSDKRQSRLRVLDSNNGAQLIDIALPDSFFGLRASYDGSSVLGFEQGNAHLITGLRGRIVRLPTPNVPPTIGDTGGRVERSNGYHATGGTFSPNGAEVAVVFSPGYDRIVPIENRVPSRVHIFDSMTGRELRSFQIPGPVGELRYSDDGSNLVVVAPEQISVHRVNDGHRLVQYPSTQGTVLSSVSISPDGTQFSAIERGTQGCRVLTWPMPGINNASQSDFATLWPQLRSDNRTTAMRAAYALVRHREHRNALITALRDLRSQNVTGQFRDTVLTQLRGLTRADFTERQESHQALLRQIQAGNFQQRAYIFSEIQAYLRNQPSPEGIGRAQSLLNAAVPLVNVPLGGSDIRQFQLGQMILNLQENED